MICRICAATPLTARSLLPDLLGRRNQSFSPSRSARRTLVLMVGLGLASIPALAVQFKVVHQFDGAHGGDPIGGLVFDREGNLYGTAALGGRQFSADLLQGSKSTLVDLAFRKAHIN